MFDSSSSTRDVDVQVRQGHDAQRLMVHLTNLRDQGVTLRAELSPGLQSQGPDGEVGRGVMVTIAAYGHARVELTVAGTA